ncbi:hypothetical protein YPPY60_4821, partial [Yersinia pestis PY-60]
MGGHAAHWFTPAPRKSLHVLDNAVFLLNSNWKLLSRSLSISGQ